MSAPTPETAPAFSKGDRVHIIKGPRPLTRQFAPAAPGNTGTVSSADVDGDGFYIDLDRIPGVKNTDTDTALAPWLLRWYFRTDELESIQ